MENNYLETNENGELVIKKGVLNELNNLRTLAKKTADEYKKLSDAVSKEIMVITDNKPTRVSDYNLVKKGGAWTFTFSELILKEKYPEIYDKCLVPTQEKITFSLVYAVRKKKGE